MNEVDPIRENKPQNDKNEGIADKFVHIKSISHKIKKKVKHNLNQDYNR